MSEVNPYESPRCPEPVVVAELVEPAGEGVWRQGKLLVMHKRAVLPDRCVKTNRPARGHRLGRTFYWHHPVFYLAILGCLVGYLVIVFFVQHSAEIRFGVSPEWLIRRRRAFFISGSLTVLAIVVAAVQAQTQNPWVMDGAEAVFVALVLAAGYWAYTAQLIHPVRMEGDFVWLKGVHPDYLAELPVRPDPP